MQAVKPEWADLQDQFTVLALSTRVSHLIEALKVLQQQVEVDCCLTPGSASEEPFHKRSAQTDSCNLLLRRIQRYVEWTVPELLPERAEAAETLVNVARFAARLLIQESAGNTNSVPVQIEQLINQVSLVKPIV